MKHKETSLRKSSVVLITVLNVVGLLLIGCPKSGDLPDRPAAGSGTQESKSETKEIKPEFGEKEMEDAEEKKVVFTSALAQRGWYPADAGAMRSQITGFFEKVDVTPKQDVIALILPHAGYRYSGQTAAYGVKAAAKRYNRIVVIGPSHYANMPGVLSVPEVTHYSTPLGLVPLDTQFIAKLKKNLVFRSIGQAHQYEHSVQIEIPLLQYGRGDFKLVPIVAGQCSLQQIKSAAATLKGLVDNDTLVVASSDFVHYGSNYGYTPFTEDIPNQIKKLDMGAFEHIAKLDVKGFLEYKQKTGATICGFIPIAILLAMCPESTKAELLKYTTSGEILGDFSNSVSYLAVAFSGKWNQGNPMEEENQTTKLSGVDKENLLKLARRSLEFYLKEKRPPTASDVGIEVTDTMKREGAAFVTLKKNGMLRGCIGDIIPRGPLYESVIRNAVNAGVKDWRFPPVTGTECDQLDFEISALSVPEPIDSPEEIRIGTDGVILEKQGRSAVFLPQVAPEQGWDVNQMLSHLSVKANLGADAWKQDARFLVFQADVFSEHE